MSILKSGGPSSVSNITDHYSSHAANNEDDDAGGVVLMLLLGVLVAVVAMNTVMIYHDIF